MADPNNSGINASGPFGMEPADTQIGAFGQGMLKIPSWLYETNKDIGDAMLAAPGQIIDYLGSPTEAGQAKMDEEAALAEQMSQFADIEAGADQPNMFFGGPEGEFGGLGVDAEVDDIATTLAALDIMPSTVEGGRGTVVEKPGDREVAVTQEQTDEGFLAAMDDFFESARGAGPAVPEKRTIEEYKKAFSEATGIDTSGKVDKKDALMAFGLALMQNKAGKGFNVSKMLTSVGEAGDKAMPALQRAKNLAREGALAGGKYALQTQSADKAIRAAGAEKAMNRSQYWVYERGEPGAEFAGFDKGQIVPLSKYELNKLINDPAFESQYEFISAADRMDVLAKRAEGLDLGDEWTNDLKSVSLIGGKADNLPAALVVAGHPADANYGGKPSARYKIGESEDGVKRRFADYQNEIVGNEEKLSLLIANIQEGITLPEQLFSKVQQLGKSFGMSVDTSSVASAQQSLANIAIDNVLEILKESGRTISEGERKRVEKRVGNIDMSLAGSNPELVLNQVKYVYDMVVTKPQRDLDNALKGFEENFGYSISGGSNSNLPTESELEQVNALRKSRGEKPLTMESY